MYCLFGRGFESLQLHLDERLWNLLTNKTLFINDLECFLFSINFHSLSLDVILVGANVVANLKFTPPKFKRLIFS